MNKRRPHTCTTCHGAPRPRRRAWPALLLALAACAPQNTLLEPAPTRVEPPPGDVLVKPGPNAENELDPALFADLPPHVRQELGLPAASDGAAASSAPATPDATRTNAAPSKKARTPATQDSKGIRIGSVAVTEVTGAPGKGNAELARALRLVLRKAGWPVHARARPDSMRITGRVELGPKTPRGQRVRLKWTVKAPNGKLLGVIDQSNIVPSGSLDKGFGATALPAAQGAADGIFQLIRRLKNS